ncbi:hypothetical protein LJC12_00465 [Odoribacter sp. OttesenSCG-928-J03]|nr:hypothetical protein [Odoribacter sp. OttesenSCG-928-J03]
MTQDSYILIAFCVFMLLLGMRLRNRFALKKKGEPQERINKNQRPKMADSEEPPFVKEKRLKRERRVRRFTIVQLVVLFCLMIYMIPALVRDIAMPAGVDFSNLFLRSLIFLLTIYIFVVGYIKVFGKKHKAEQDNEVKG